LVVQPAELPYDKSVPTLAAAPNHLANRNPFILQSSAEFLLKLGQMKAVNLKIHLAVKCPFPTLFQTSGKGPSGP